MEAQTVIDDKMWLAIKHQKLDYQIFSSHLAWVSERDFLWVALLLGLSD